MVGAKGEHSSPPHRKKVNWSVLRAALTTTPEWISTFPHSHASPQPPPPPPSWGCYLKQRSRLVPFGGICRRCRQQPSCCFMLGRTLAFVFGGESVGWQLKQGSAWQALGATDAKPGKQLWDPQRWRKRFSCWFPLKTPHAFYTEIEKVSPNGYGSHGLELAIAVPVRSCRYQLPCRPNRVSS